MALVFLISCCRGESDATDASPEERGATEGPLVEGPSAEGSTLLDRLGRGKARSFAASIGVRPS